MWSWASVNRAKLAIVLSRAPEDSASKERVHSTLAPIGLGGGRPVAGALLAIGATGCLRGENKFRTRAAPSKTTSDTTTSLSLFAADKGDGFDSQPE